MTCGFEKNMIRTYLALIVTLPVGAIVLNLNGPLAGAFAVFVTYLVSFEVIQLLTFPSGGIDVSLGLPRNVLRSFIFGIAFFVLSTVGGMIL